MAGVVEPVEDLIEHELFTSLQFPKSGIDGRDQLIEALPFQFEQLGVDPKRGHLAQLAGQNALYLRYAKAESPQQQDPLQSQQRPLVVIAVAVLADAARLEQADLPVVTKRPARRPGGAGYLLNRPFHLSVSCCPNHRQRRDGLT